MSREKQIVEQLTKDIKFYKGAIPNPKEDPDHQLARLLVKDGYRKQSEGEWIVDYNTSKTPSARGRIMYYETYTCSKCGKSNGRKKSNYCPNCGAKMKGGAG